MHHRSYTAIHTSLSYRLLSFCPSILERTVLKSLVYRSFLGSQNCGQWREFCLGQLVTLFQSQDPKGRTCTPLFQRLFQEPEHIPHQKGVMEEVRQRGATTFV
jgi:hypothetical protein